MILLGLERIEYLCRILGNPQDRLRFIHIAGTNGKGSTGAFLSYIINEAKYKVGWYATPAVFSRQEVIKINNRSITKDDYLEGLSEINLLLDEQEEGIRPTEFEKETALALKYFADNNCDLVVLECGMGGESDATNIIKNTLVSVFTPISLDHIDYLGSDITQIATVKSGIIKEGCKVVSAIQSPEVQEILSQKAQSLNCSFKVAHFQKYAKDSMGLKGIHQSMNASVAVEVIMSLKEYGINIPEKCIKNGLHKAKLPGRFEIIGKKPTFILDGGHNEAAAINLRDNLMEYYPKCKIIHIVGMLVNKDHKAYMETMSSVDTTILTVSTFGERAYSAENLARDVLPYSKEVSAIGGVYEALDIAYMMAGAKDVIVVSGSFTILEDAKKWFRQKQIK